MEHSYREGDQMRDDKIIPFPNVKQRLAENGMMALQQSDYGEALTYFDQLLAIEPKHPQANLGKAICLFEQGSLEDAAHICDYMLRHRLGHMHEVIQVYVSILIQCERYEAAVKILTRILRDESLSVNLSKFYHEMIAYCQKMIEEKNEASSRLSKEDVKYLTELLYSKQIDKQVAAITKLTKQPNESMVNILKQFLQNDKNDPLVKSIIIQSLRAEKIDETFEIQKFSKRMYINPARMDAVENASIFEQAREKLSDMLENDNPTLHELCLQILSKVAMTIYPFPLPIEDAKLLAAMVHFEGTNRMGIYTTQAEICALYYIREEELVQCLHDFAVVLKQWD